MISGVDPAGAVYDTREFVDPPAGAALSDQPTASGRAGRLTPLAPWTCPPGALFLQFLFRKGRGAAQQGPPLNPNSTLPFPASRPDAPSSRSPYFDRPRVRRLSRAPQDGPSSLIPRGGTDTMTVTRSRPGGMSRPLYLFQRQNSLRRRSLLPPLNPGIARALRPLRPRRGPVKPSPRPPGQGAGFFWPRPVPGLGIAKYREAVGGREESRAEQGNPETPRSLPPAGCMVAVFHAPFPKKKSIPEGGPFPRTRWEVAPGKSRVDPGDAKAPLVGTGGVPRTGCPIGGTKVGGAVAEPLFSPLASQPLEDRPSFSGTGPSFFFSDPPEKPPPALVFPSVATRGPESSQAHFLVPASEGGKTAETVRPAGPGKNRHRCAVVDEGMGQPRRSWSCSAKRPGRRSPPPSIRGEESCPVPPTSISTRDGSVLPYRGAHPRA